MWGLGIQGNSPQRKMSLVCKASFAENIATVVMLPWRFSCLSFFLLWWSFLWEGGVAVSLERGGKERETLRAVVWRAVPTGGFPFLPTCSPQHFLFQ